MAKIQIIVGTVEGRALQTAQAMSMILAKLGHDTDINIEPEPQDLLRDTDELLLICSSTTGNGEPPPNIYGVYRALDYQKLDLTGRRYGVVALGDTGYQHFAQAGYLIENALYQCGARRIGNILAMDARAVPNQPLTAALWAKEWCQQLA